MNLNPLLKQDIFKTVGKAADELGYPTFIIGGYVRDLILERSQPKDIDLVCLGSGIALAKKVASMLKPGNISISRLYSR